MTGCNFMHHHHHHHRGEGLWPFRGWITPSRVGWVKVKWPAPPLHDPRRQCTLPRLCSLPSYIPRSPAFRGSRERGEGEKSCITLQGKISETKVGLCVLGGCEQWQLSVRARLQRLAEWLLWVILCCRSLRKFTDVFSYETPLWRLKYPVAWSTSPSLPPSTFPSLLSPALSLSLSLPHARALPRHLWYLLYETDWEPVSLNCPQSIKSFFFFFCLYSSSL